MTFQYRLTIGEKYRSYENVVDMHYDLAKVLNGEEKMGFGRKVDLSEIVITLEPVPAPRPGMED